MARSRIGVLKANLKTVLAARSALAAVQVSNNGPFPLPEPEFIWIGRAKAKQHAATFKAGRDPREEEILLDVFIRTTRSNLEAETEASDRVLDLMGEIEDALRDDPTVAGACRVAEIESYELDEWTTAEQRVADLLLVVTACERI